VCSYLVEERAFFFTRFHNGYRVFLDSPGGQTVGPCILGVIGGTLVRKSCLGVRNNLLKIPPPPPVLSALGRLKCPQNQFFANISQSMKPTGKIVEAEDVPCKIFYRIDYSRVSLCLPISLKIHSKENISKYWPFSRFRRLLCKYLAIYEP